MNTKIKKERQNDIRILYSCHICSNTQSAPGDYPSFSTTAIRALLHVKELVHARYPFTSPELSVVSRSMSWQRTLVPRRDSTADLAINSPVTYPLDNDISKEKARERERERERKRVGRGEKDKWKEIEETLPCIYFSWLYVLPHQNKSPPPLLFLIFGHLVHAAPIAARPLIHRQGMTCSI